MKKATLLKSLIPAISSQAQLSVTSTFLPSSSAFMLWDQLTATLCCFFCAFHWYCCDSASSFQTSHMSGWSQPWQLLLLIQVTPRAQDRTFCPRHLLIAAALSRAIESGSTRSVTACMYSAKAPVTWWMGFKPCTGARGGEEWALELFLPYQILLTRSALSLLQNLQRSFQRICVLISRFPSLQ